MVCFGRKQNLIDLMEDPVNADVVAVHHVSLIDEDAVLKTYNIQTINTKTSSLIFVITSRFNIKSVSDVLLKDFLMD